MIVCKVCGGPVSRNAPACPKCGEPPPIAKFANSFTGTVFGMVALIVLLLAVMWVFGVFR